MQSEVKEFETRQMAYDWAVRNELPNAKIILHMKGNSMDWLLDKKELTIKWKK